MAANPFFQFLTVAGASSFTLEAPWQKPRGTGTGKIQKIKKPHREDSTEMTPKVPPAWLTNEITEFPWRVGWGLRCLKGFATKH